MTGAGASAQLAPTGGPPGGRPIGPSLSEVAVTRVRQARRCRARRGDGNPCKAYAMLGAEVCRAHGGAAPQVRDAARRRVTEADIQRAADAAIARHRRELQEWYAKRIATASRLLGIPVADFIGPHGVNEALLAWSRLQHGAPEGLESKPRLRTDRRFAAVRALEAGADLDDGTSDTP